jgi:glycosyltransferase involved in cell wall biosynthesis
MDGLIQSTDFVVNASLAEGQCLPLLEFMAAGVPAIAPDHTAMETYINNTNAFVVASSKQPYIWPNDPRRALRTVSNRIDWDSLRQAYVDSAEVLEEDRARYEVMSQAAVNVVQQHYSVERVARDLENFLTITARRKRWLSRLLG